MSARKLIMLWSEFDTKEDRAKFQDIIKNEYGFSTVKAFYYAILKKDYVLVTANEKKMLDKFLNE